MEEKERGKICVDAIKTYGTQSQEWMIIEEMSELMKEICKHQRGKNNREHIVEEMADVYIMLAQARIMYNVSDDEINYMTDTKLARLRNRMRGADGND